MSPVPSNILFYNSKCKRKLCFETWRQFGKLEWKLKEDFFSPMWIEKNPLSWLKMRIYTYKKCIFKYPIKSGFSICETRKSRWENMRAVSSFTWTDKVRTYETISILHTCNISLLLLLWGRVESWNRIFWMREWRKWKFLKL